MPEGPELKITCDNLNKLLNDKEIIEQFIFSQSFYPIFFCFFRIKFKIITSKFTTIFIHIYIFNQYFINPT
jgi:hypothetical protein